MFFCAIFHPIKTGVINEQKSSNFSSEDLKSKDENSMNENSVNENSVNGSSKDLESKTMELDLNELKNETKNQSNVKEKNQSSLQKNLLVTTHGGNISLTLLALVGIWRESLRFVTFSMMVSLITLVSFTINFDLITSLEIVAELSFFLLCLLFVITIRIKREYYNYDEREQEEENVHASRDTIVVPFSD